MCIIHNIKKLYMTQKAASERDPCREDPGERKPGEDTTGRLLGTQRSRKSRDTGDRQAEGRRTNI